LENKKINTLSIWLKNSSVSKQSFEMKTLQTKPRSGAKTSAVKRRGSDSDVQTETPASPTKTVKRKELMAVQNMNQEKN
jgi:hypothetical protein